MLSRLVVSNLAVVEHAEAEFGSGLNVLTGETGAGKSVLMGALELVLGGRADAGIVREGAKEAEVEAQFGEAVVRRTVTVQGRSRAWINEESVSLAELKQFGEGRVDIHGPRANQRILEEGFQRETLDSCGGVELGEYAAAHAKYVEANRRLEDFRNSVASADELDLWRYQAEEIESAHLTEADADLPERHAAAAHAAEIVEAANDITEGIGGEGGAMAALARIGGSLATAAKHLQAAREWAKEADEITVRLDELSRSVAEEVSRLGVEPAEFAAMDERLAVVNRLNRKYGDPLAKLKTLREKLEAAEDRETVEKKLTGELAAAEAAVRGRAAEVTAERKAAAKKLAKRVTAELRDLGFLQAKFDVRIEPGEIGPHGCDTVTYMFEPNPGEAARPLASVASSGEAARVMLALKAVLAEHDATEVLVFDEIDANIGGEVGAVVGAKMRAVAEHHQVIAITHLPQSAACGDRHLVVSKGVSGGRTRTRISVVEGEDRVTELARMLGGDRATGIVRKHAEELLGISGRMR